MEPDWPCNLCGDPIYSGRQPFVVITFSWRIESPDHFCEGCWQVLAQTAKAGARLALAANL